jgi:DNA primase
MPISHFDRSALPPPQGFYQSELGKLTRPSRGWARTTCPFHQGSNKTAFAVNLETGGFFCFNCGVKGGDVLDFVKLRDRVDFKRAAQQLGAWRDQEMSPAEKREMRHRELERARRRVEETARKQAEHDRRIRARDRLHAVDRLYADAIAEHDWELMPLLLPVVRESEELYWKAAGIELRSDACCKVIEVRHEQ